MRTYRVEANVDGVPSRREACLLREDLMKDSGVIVVALHCPEKSRVFLSMNWDADLVEIALAEFIGRIRRFAAEAEWEDRIEFGGVCARQKTCESVSLDVDV